MYVPAVEVHANHKYVWIGVYFLIGQREGRESMTLHIIHRNLNMEQWKDTESVYTWASRKTKNKIQHKTMHKII